MKNVEEYKKEDKRVGKRKTDIPLNVYVAYFLWRETKTLDQREIFINTVFINPDILILIYFIISFSRIRNIGTPWQS